MYAETNALHYVVPQGFEPTFEGDAYGQSLKYVYDVAKDAADCPESDGIGPWIEVSAIYDVIHAESDPPPEGTFDEDGYTLEEWVCRLAASGALIVRKTIATQSLVTRYDDEDVV